MRWCVRRVFGCQTDMSGVQKALSNYISDAITKQTCEAKEKICQAHGRKIERAPPAAAACRAGAPLKESPGMPSKKGTTRRGRCAIRPPVVKVPPRGFVASTSTEEAVDSVLFLPYGGPLLRPESVAVSHAWPDLPSPLRECRSIFRRIVLYPL